MAVVDFFAIFGGDESVGSGFDGAGFDASFDLSTAGG